MFYKFTISDDSASQQQNRLHIGLENEFFFDDCQPYFEDEDEIQPDEILQFAQEFNEGIQNRSLAAISESLCKFIFHITYLDESRRTRRKTLSKYAIQFIDENPPLADDFVFCLKELNTIDIHRLVLDLIDYFSVSPIFINDIIDRGGLYYITLHVKVLENQEILLKSIQILKHFTKNEKSHCILTSSQFTTEFFKVCDSLFTDNSYQYINEMIFASSFILQQIVEIVTFYIRNDTNPNQIAFSHPQNQHIKFESIINRRIYSILMKFFLPKLKNNKFQKEYYIYPQLIALKSLKLLYFDPFFVKKVFPSILKMIPKMVQLNKIESYALIRNIYEYEYEDQYKTSYIQEYVPWKCLKESLRSSSKDEIFAALSVFNAMFRYNNVAISTALKNDVAEPLICLIDTSSFDVKNKALHVVYSWLFCTDIDRDRSLFVCDAFVDLLFPIQDSENSDLKNIVHEILLFIKTLAGKNFKNVKLFNYIDSNIIDI